MLVGLIAPPWIPVPPPAYGGTEAVLAALAPALARAGVDVVMAAHPDTDLPGVEVIRGTSIPRHIVIGHAPAEAAFALESYRQLLAAGVDVIHDHTVVGPLVASDLIERSGVPVAVTHHGPFDEWSRVLLAEASRRAAIVAISHSQALGAGPVPIAVVIHHGIDVSSIAPGNGDGGYLAYLGRFAPEKGALQAARTARAAGARLLIAAKMWEPAEHEWFTSHIAPLLGDGVEYIGEIGGREKTELLGAATALVNPIQWNEPFGMTMVESLACGTPVVATARGAAPEIVRHGVTGMLCTDQAGLVASVEQVRDIDRAECRADVRRRFSAERLAADHIALYQTLIERRASGRQLDPVAPTALG